MTVIGYARKRGEFDGKHYDNVNIYCTRPGEPSNDETGAICEVVKVKYDLFPSVVDVGVEIQPFYDKFGRVVDIRIV